MRTTFVPPFTADTAKELQRKIGPATLPEPASKPGRGEVLLVGFDFGTNTSCIKASYAGTTDLVVNETIPTVVGYASEGIVENLLPSNAKILFGQNALKSRMYLRLVSPLADGVVDDLSAAQDFARHVRQVLNPPQGTEVRAVIGVPANVERPARETMCQAVSGLFDKVLLVPEPFLAALGYRDEARLSDPSYLDPVRNALIVDIGAGTTNVCMVQGYFPTAEDQMSIPFAGDKVDGLISDALRKAYPDISLSMVKVREIKETHSFVGKNENPVSINLVVAGKMRKLDVGEPVAKACEQLLQRTVDCVKAIIAKSTTDTVADLMQNIVLTGGGSRIRHFDTELQRLLAEDGFERPRVQTVGESYKDFVAKGALLVARQARDAQWQRLTA